eukprot:4271363-Amphidinium_carterae.1
MQFFAIWAADWMQQMRQQDCLRPIFRIRIDDHPNPIDYKVYWDRIQGMHHIISHNHMSRIACEVENKTTPGSQQPFTNSSHWPRKPISTKAT